MTPFYRTDFCTQTVRKEGVMARWTMALLIAALVLPALLAATATSAPATRTCS